MLYIALIPWQAILSILPSPGKSPSSPPPPPPSCRSADAKLPSDVDEREREREKERDSDPPDPLLPSRRRARAPPAAPAFTKAAAGFSPSGRRRNCVSGRRGRENELVHYAHLLCFS